MRNIARFIAAVLVVGCASTGNVTDAPIDTPSKRILAAEADYYVAFEIAAAYEALPRCPVETGLCSDPGVVERLRGIDNAFVAARDAAWAAYRTPNEAPETLDAKIAAVVSVVAQLVALVPTLVVETAPDPLEMRIAA